MKQKKIKDHLHSESLSNDDNMNVFNEVYDSIDDLVQARTKFEADAFGIEDEETVKKIELNAAKYYYDRIIKIVNIAIDGWKA
tara:strand:+ start:450 stop:698 length:249 start_codon:yes stop_codon:yes gene_type:complete